ncbi:hypothetical protein [Maridesulfovibrio sp.]|uniref:hypothetical protein n=1 Tax=Maridesulfovibrio sp. TaxID=2795000 RepID=UPI0039EF8826
MHEHDEFLRELAELEKIKKEVQPVIDMTANQRAVAGILTILSNVDAPLTVLKAARYQLRIIRGELPNPALSTGHNNEDKGENLGDLGSEQKN